MAMEALARARAFRAEAQAARPSGADIAARVEATHQRAQERGQVEKTAGESGAAGNLKRKWEKWLASAHGQGVAARLAHGGAPTVADAKRFTASPRTRTSRGRHTRASGGEEVVQPLNNNT